MKYDVRTYGDEILRQAANSVEKVTDSIRRLAADMLETMRSRKGVGLAAQQIGRTEAICVVDLPELSANLLELKHIPVSISR